MDDLVIIDGDGRIKIKVILIGNSAVGKTNLINVASGGSFDESTKSSLSASFVIVKKTVSQKDYNLYLWDTIGQEKLRSLTKMFFKDSKIVIFVYDITRRDTFEGLKDWHKEVTDTLGDDIIKGVVGNKSDLFLQEQVKDNEGEKYAKSINARFRATSAKNDPRGFSEFLTELLEQYDNKYSSKDGQKNKNNNNNGKIQLDGKKKTKKGGFC